MKTVFPHGEQVAPPFLKILNGGEELQTVVPMPAATVNVLYSAHSKLLLTNCAVACMSLLKRPLGAQV
jgi:hypothetical protein